MQTSEHGAVAVEVPPTDSLVVTLIAAAACAAGVVFAVYAGGFWDSLRSEPLALVAFLAAGGFLQLRVIEVPDQGAVSFASVAMLGAAFALGTGAGMAVAIAAAVVRLAASRGRVDRALFDAANLALSTATAAATFHVVHAIDQQPNDRFGPSFFAAAVFYVVNVGLLSAAMGLAEGRSARRILRERFLWLAPWMLAAGPFASVMVVVYDRIGVLGIVALAIAPGVLVTPVRQHMSFRRD